ncbi:hypothetical protein [Nocardia sp. NBC_00416]|uniref:hypothetical protein n=1 Tax=Nocardia sp. NBC_00416 TaxID=2975991 RepID=UPI002E1C4C72
MPEGRNGGGITRRTVAGEWRAVWCRDQRGIRITEVRHASGARLPIAAGEAAPDLADMRERFPDLAPLWDAVRHHFWTQTAPAGIAG